jgi:RimJ/RimL family protein N-acetyltransferase
MTGFKDHQMIETPRLLLRPMRAEDAPPLLRVFGDPMVMAAFDEVPFDLPQMERWVERNLAHQDAHGYGLFTVIHKQRNEVIGDCGLERMDIGENKSVELGYDLRSDCWNQGLATEAATAVCRYAFERLGLPRLVSLIRQGNIPSRRVAQKVGMRHVDDVTGGRYPYWLFAISAGEIDPDPSGLRATDASPGRDHASGKPRRRGAETPG